MAFSKREKTIIAAAVTAVCLLVGDSYVLTPLLDQRAGAEARTTRLLAKMENARGLLKRRRVYGRRWQDMLADGMKRGPTEAESQLLRSLRDWWADARLRLSSLRPERSLEESQLPEITVHAAGTGSMDGVTRLLWRIQTARIPVKIKLLQLGSRRDGTDDLSLHLKVSTLYFPAGPTSPEQVANGPARTRGD